MTMPILSFCIPTYNRSDLVIKSVNNILSYPGDEIEVVVSNNCSTDNTAELLSSITDQRFSFKTTEKNIGLLNFVRALELGNGEYSCLLSDEDEVFIESITPIVNFLKRQKDISLVACSLERLTLQQYSNKLSKKGYDAYWSVTKYIPHMSGLIYKRSLIDGDLEKYDTVFPYVDLNKSAALKGNVQFLETKICSFGDRSDVETDPKTSFVNGKIFWEEGFLYEELKKNIDRTQLLPFSDSQKKNLELLYLEKYFNNFIAYSFSSVDWVGEFRRGLIKNPYTKKKDIVYINEIFSDIVKKGSDYLYKTGDDFWMRAKEIVLYLYKLNEFSYKEKVSMFDDSILINDLVHGCISKHDELFGPEYEGINDVLVKDLNYKLKFMTGKFEELAALKEDNDSFSYLFYAGKALKIIKNYKKAATLMECYINKYESGFDYFQIATDLDSILSMYFNLAESYEKQGNVLDAKKYYTKCIDFSERLELPSHQAAINSLSNI